MRTLTTNKPRKGQVIEHVAYGRVLVLAELSDGWYDIRDTNGDEWTTTGAYPVVTCESEISPNHSDDAVTVWRGSFVPTVWCGYHATREGVSL